MPLAQGPIGLPGGWRLIVAFEAGRAWCSWLYDPDGIQRAVWVGKRDADDLIDSAAGFLDVQRQPEAARSLRRHYEAIR